MALLEGDLASARTYCDEAIEMHRSDPERAAWEIYRIRSKIALAEGQRARSRGFLRQALTFSRKHVAKRTGAATLEGMAALEQAEGQGERAAQLLGAAAALREALGTPLRPIDMSEHETLRAALHEALGEDAFAAAFAAGRALNWEEAVAYALEEPAA
jgi:hypothetical protein